MSGLRAFERNSPQRPVANAVTEYSAMHPKIGPVTEQKTELNSTGWRFPSFGSSRIGGDQPLQAAP
jgi:hypothetical protein